MPKDTATTIQDPVEDDYISAEDEDFEVGAAQDDSDLSSDDEAAEPQKKKRKTEPRQAPDIQELDSGDEATIRKVRDKKEKKRKGKKSKGGRARDSDDDGDIDIDMDDEEGGTGGFVRTRAMRKHM